MACELTIYLLSQILDCFWKLASNSSEERVQAAAFLTSECEQAEKGQSTSSAPEVSSGLWGSSAPLTRYCLKRLVSGLSSTRDSARQGFALALSGIVSVIAERYSCVSDVALYMDEVFSNKDGQDVIGHLFGIGSIVQSNIKFSDVDIDCLTNNLLDISNAKSFVREASIELLIKLAYQIKQDRSLLNVYFSCEKLRQILEADPGKSTTPPEVVTLGIRLWPLLKKEFDIDCRILPSNSILSSIDFTRDKFEDHDDFSGATPMAIEQLFSRSHLESLSKCLKMSTYSHPRMHGSWESMLRLLIPGYESNEIDQTINLASLDNFWNVLVENSLFASPSHERKYLGILLFKTMLPSLDQSATEILITKNFIKCLGNNVNKQTYLNRASVQAVELLAEKIRNSEDWNPDKILCRISDYSGNQLYHIFKNSGVKIDPVKAPGIPVEILESLSNCKDGNALQQGHISRIPGIVKRHQNDPEALEDLFKILLDVYLSPHQDTLSEETEEARIKTIGSLLNSIGILSKSHSNIESLVNMEVRILDYLNLKSREASKLTDSSESYRNLRENVTAKVNMGEAKKMYHFLHLTCLLELYSIINPLTADPEMADDLHNVFSKLISNNRRENHDEENVEWQDVLVDCILSVISRNEAPYPSAPLRDSGELLFRYFSGDILRNGLSSMLDVLVQPLDEIGTHDKESEDDGGDDIEMDESELDESEEGSESESEDIQDLRESDMDIDLPDVEEDATDEQMFKMDSMLGAYFASHANIKSKKQLREDSINFKLRVISCLEIYMRLNPDSPLLLEAPEPLLSSLVSVSRPDGSQVLSERLSGLIKNKLCKCKCREANLSNTDAENVKQQLRKALYLASRSPVKVVADSSVAAYMFLQRCLHHTAYLKNVADESLEACLSDYFTKKKSKLTKSFLPELFRKIPEIADISLPTLVDQCSEARSPYLRAEAFIILGNVLQKMDTEVAESFFKQNKDLTSKLLESSSDLQGGKKREVQKIVAKVKSMI